MCTLFSNKRFFYCFHLHVTKSMKAKPTVPNIATHQDHYHDHYHVHVKYKMRWKQRRLSRWCQNCSQLSFLGGFILLFLFILDLEVPFSFTFLTPCCFHPVCFNQPWNTSITLYSVHFYNGGSSIQVLLSSHF